MKFNNGKAYDIFTFFDEKTETRTVKVFDTVRGFFIEDLTTEVTALGQVGVLIDGWLADKTLKELK